MKTVNLSVICGLLFSIFPLFSQSVAKQPVDYVNPYIGGISHLLVPTYPTIHLPNSMLRVYPERADFTGDLLNGLPLVVTSHRGSSAFNLSPFQGSVDDLQPVIQYSYDQEKITPYSYSVYLDEEEVEVKYAVSHQSGIYELQFLGNEETVSLVVNSRRGAMRWDGKAVSGFQQLDNNTKVYIYLEPDVLPVSVRSFHNGIWTKERQTSGDNAAVVLHYAREKDNLTLRYGISFIDEQQAKKNFEREIRGRHLPDIATSGRDLWNKTLGKLSVEGGSEDHKAVFYTSLYRTYERPVCISEDGRYFSAFDGKVHNDEGIPFYTDDWIWDTYRATHPLRTIIEPDMERDIIRSFLRMSEQTEHYWWPTFPEITGDSRRMNSNHGVATVIDAYRKGIRGYDLTKIYEACKNALTQKTLAPWSAKPAGELDRFYHTKGYIPALREGEEETIPEVHSFEKRQPVAVTLGTAYDEWCLAQIAKELGKEADYRYFLEKSYNYRHLFNPNTGFFHPKDKEGRFIEPFDYAFPGGMGAREFYGENNGWIYRWDVQHNIPDLIQLMGGDSTFVKNLDRMFSEPLGRSKYDFYAKLPDHTGNVGQFSMANEPSLHIPYLYVYAGQPWKTQKRIHTLIDQWFRNDLMGVPGDEDGGGMTAFVVFSQMGFYPVTPGLPVYTIGSPFFEKTVIQLPNGKTFTVKAENFSGDNKYIQSAKLNGKEWNRAWIEHSAIVNGGVLELTMGDKANVSWGSGLSNYFNPVVRSDAPDPSVILAEDGCFYLYHTGIGIHRSTNLVDWEYIGNAFTDAGRPRWEPNAGLWAPDINYIDGKYVMYYSMSVWGGEQTCGIGVAISDKPEGPFTDHGKLFRSNEIGVQNSIDPFYIEENGKKYLFWGSFRGIYGIELTDDGLNLKPGAEKKQVAGTAYEGTYIHKRGDYYYLFGSIGTCCEGVKSTYTTVVGRSKNLWGPYVDQSGGRMLDNKHEIVLHGNGLFKGTGHNSEIFQDKAGNDWILYHAFEIAHPDRQRQVLLDRIHWENGWPTVKSNAPSSGAEAPEW